MTEHIEIRLPEDGAKLLFSPDEGRSLAHGLGRAVVLPADDSRWPEIHALREAWQQLGRGLILGWDVIRKYTTDEVSSAPLFHALLTRTFEPAGEQCGTLYDESASCVVCGAGAAQTSALMLKERRIPSRADVATTIAAEVVIRSALVKEFGDAGISVGEVGPVINASTRKSEDVSRTWVQLFPAISKIEVVPPTKTGINPWNPDPANRYRCPFGHTIGLNLVSSLCVRGDIGRNDLAATEEYVGVRRGLLRPRRLLLASPKLHALCVQRKVQGISFEPVSVQS